MNIVYGDNEELIGRWLKRNPTARPNLFLATKFAATVDPKTLQPRIRNDPEYINQAITRSLTRLGVDCIDLYYCHRLVADQPIEITVGEMKKLQDAGKIRYIGLSECSAESLRRACKIVHVDAVQIEYSPFSLDIESPEIDLLRACRELGVAVVAYSPLGRGFLTGAITSREDFEETDFRKHAPRFSEENFGQNLKLVETIKGLAAKKGVSAGQLTLAWELAQGEDVIPIPGTTRMSNFDDNIGALKVKISDEENREIRAAIEKAEVAGGRYPEAFADGLFVTTKPL